MIKASFILVVCVALSAQDIEYSFNTPIPDKSVILSNVTMHTVNKTNGAETVITGDVIVTAINSDGDSQTVYYFVPYNKVGIIWMITKPGPNKGEKAFYGAMTPGGAVLAAEDTKWALFTARKIRFAVDENGAYIEYNLELEE
jgi:hypothetical protein